MPRSVPVRGVIEGFYGSPWSPDARLELVEFIGEHSMNAYVYAPKSDPKHRDRWREPYEGEELAHFTHVAGRANAHGVRFGFALSPGLDIDYTGASDRTVVMSKLVPLLDAGVSWFVLALDDIPTRLGLARDQADLAGWLLDALRARDERVRLTVVPTEYIGSMPTPYLRDLGAGLPPDVDLMWTGPTVCSPVIGADDARAWTAATGRAPIIWDNFPVNDGSMERSLHLGPYVGREPALTDFVEGVLCNPMVQPHASKLGLACAAAYLRDPAGYDPHEAWERAVEATGGPRAKELSEIASACADSPLLPPRWLKARRRVAALAAAADRSEQAEAAGAVGNHLRGVRDAARVFADAGDDPLAHELAPWLEQARAETDAGLAALRLLEHVGRDGAEVEAAMLHAFATVFAWGHARHHRDRVVFGPRFAVYPAVVQLSSGLPGLDVDLAVVENENAIDELCRLALARYREWSAAAVGTPG